MLHEYYSVRGPDGVSKTPAGSFLRHGIPTSQLRNDISFFVCILFDYSLVCINKYDSSTVCTLCMLGDEVMNPLHRQSQKTAPLVRTANKSRPVAQTRNGEDEGCDGRVKGPTRKLQTEKLRRKRSVVLRRQPPTSTQVSSSTAI